MTLTQLRTFLAVADTGSVHAAARQMFVTQSAVSAALNALQKSLGLQLLERDGRGLRLTRAGEVYADHARTALGLLDQARSAAAAETDPERGELRIAALTTAGEQILPGVLASFREQHPHVGVRLEVGNREHVRRLLERHEVDLVLGGRPEPGREVEVLATRPHELIVVASTPGRGTPAWLSAQTWLLREPGSGTRAITESFLAQLELDPPPRTLTLGSNTAVIESAVSGLGTTLVSKDAVIRHLAEGHLTEIPTEATPLLRDWHLTTNPGPQPPTTTLFTNHLTTTAHFRTP
ncbi:LysR family transcriptional regulator [Saccharopolyspora sp. NPDC049357]|uniref:LysR family transcriptional regulator n=1 Tax=Saccharopolyspora sp. NPDC049357 TaxID=3154507 RepID=UPI00343512E8